VDACFGEALLKQQFLKCLKCEFIVDIKENCYEEKYSDRLIYHDEKQFGF
jgi:hypothetical protein